MKKFVWLWLPVLLWISMIFYSSSQPYQKQDVRPELSKYINLEWVRAHLSGIKFDYANYEVSIAHMGAAGFLEFFIRKGAHVLVFCMLGILLYRALSHVISRGRAAVGAWLMTALYAGLDEVHQSFTGNRTPLWQDSALDSMSAFIGISLFYLRQRKKGA
ncbi:VanZ family protein [Ectobacillus ponti]|uniref:VanZ family protein n=1 Tax=Ectobacillus ponti TaxID=2961894 RepID=A0AA41X988_9BACI|nr:VanZ family protein [Ectobacillus ponti]MCP8967711.1 VanZ family protein [Ectobacillus ponti]